MRQTTALGLKLLAYVVIFGATMPTIGQIKPGHSMILAVVHTLLLWLVEHQVLPRFGNLIAALVDVGVLIVGTFFVLGTLGALPDPAGLMMAFLLGAVFEVWFHRWLQMHRLVG